MLQMMHKVMKSLQNKGYEACGRPSTYRRGKISQGKHAYIDNTPHLIARPKKSLPSRRFVSKILQNCKKADPMSKEDELRALREARLVTRRVTDSASPVTKPVTVVPSVTSTVTPASLSIYTDAEIEAEYRRRFPPLSAAERMRRHRSKGKGNAFGD